MRQYELAIRIAQIHHLVDERKYKKALAVIQTLDVKQVRSVSDLKVFGEVYTRTERYAEAKEIYLKICRTSKNRRVLYRLVYLSIRTNSLEDAEAFYQEYLQMNPGTRDALVLRYRIDKAARVPIGRLIEILQDLKQEEYIEEWAYELAKLYHRAGRREECMEECKDIILWFGSGEIVERAKILVDHLKERDPIPYYDDKDFTLPKKEEPNPYDTGSLPDLNEFIKERKALKRADRAAKKVEADYEVDSKEIAYSEKKEEKSVKKAKGQAASDTEFIDDYEEDDFELPQVARGGIHKLSNLLKFGRKDEDKDKTDKKGEGLQEQENEEAVWKVEQERKAAEQERKAAEQERKAVEQERKAAERERKAAEQERRAAERERKVAEQKREEAERERKEAEQEVAMPEKEKTGQWEEETKKVPVQKIKEQEKKVSEPKKERSEDQEISIVEKGETLSQKEASEFEKKEPEAVQETVQVKKEKRKKKKVEYVPHSQSGTGITQDLAREITAIYEMEQQEQLKEETITVIKGEEVKAEVKKHVPEAETKEHMAEKEQAELPRPGRRVRPTVEPKDKTNIATSLVDRMTQAIQKSASNKSYISIDIEEIRKSERAKAAAKKPAPQQNIQQKEEMARPQKIRREETVRTQEMQQEAETVQTQKIQQEEEIVQSQKVPQGKETGAAKDSLAELLEKEAEEEQTVQEQAENEEALLKNLLEEEIEDPKQLPEEPKKEEIAQSEVMEAENELKEEIEQSEAVETEEETEQSEVIESVKETVPQKEEEPEEEVVQSEVAEAIEETVSQEEKEPEEEVVKSEVAEAIEETVSQEEEGSEEEVVKPEVAEAIEETVPQEEEEPEEEVVQPEVAEAIEEMVSQEEKEPEEEVVQSEVAETIEETVPQEESEEEIAKTKFVEPEEEKSEEMESTKDLSETIQAVKRGGFVLQDYHAPEIPVVETNYGGMPQIMYEDLPTTRALQQSFNDVLRLIEGELDPSHFVLMGDGVERIVGVSKKIVHVMKKSHYLSQGRIAKIRASQLNKMDLISFRTQLKGNCLLIEEASDLLFPTITKVFSIMEEYDGDFVVILSDEGTTLDQLFRFVPVLAKRFKYIIDITKYTEKDYADN